MSEDEAEEAQAPNKLWLEAINANMKKMMSEMLLEFKRELQPSPEEHKRGRARKNQELKAKPPDHTLKSTRRSSQNIPHTPKPNTAFYSGIELIKFSGKRNYLEWEENMDEWFYYNHIPSKERVPHAVKQLTGKAREWWLEEVDNRWYYRRPSITSWRDLKKLLRNKYAPQFPNHTAQANTTIQRSAVPEKTPALAPEQMKTSASVKAMKIQKAQVFSEHLDANRQELQLNSYQKHVSNMELIDISGTEQAKVSDQLNKADHNSSVNMITHLSCPKEAKKSIGEVEERSAIHHSFVCLDKDVEPSVPEPQVPADPTLKDTIIPSESTPHILLSTKISETHDLIQYWQQFMTGHCFKYSCFNDSISSMMHLFCPMSLEKETGPKGAPSFLMIKEKPPDWQSLQSVFKELKQGAPMQRRLVRGCIRSNAELNHIQERTLPCCIQLKENPPDIFLQNPKQWTYEIEYEVVSKPNLYHTQGLENSKANMEYGWTPTIIIRARDKELEYVQMRIYLFKSPFIFDYTDIIHLSLSKEPNVGRKTAWNRPRRVQKWEEDQRFKPPDLDQNKLQNFGLYFLIKKEPPDARSSPKTRSCKVGDNSDLRSNPSQVGGDDMRMDSNKQLNMRRLWSSDQKECNKLRSCQMDQLFEQRPNNLNYP